MSEISCTVGILTYNSGETLRRALKSVKEFDDIVICDGGSTDNTLEIAEEFNARILVQADKFKNPDGTLRDFGGARNQTLNAAKYDWFLFLDSDEYISESLKEDIVFITSKDIPAAYHVSRVFILKGEIICCASTYPNRQMRFFHKSVAKRFIKEVHERIGLLDNAPVFTLDEGIYVPMIETFADRKRKWTRYIKIERERRPSLSPWSWSRIALRESAAAVYRLLRALYYLLFCHGKALPIRFEFYRIWYQVSLVTALASKISWKKK